MSNHALVCHCIYQIAVNFWPATILLTFFFLREIRENRRVRRRVSRLENWTAIPGADRYQYSGPTREERQPWQPQEVARG
jgi:hypothetical protein